MPPTSCFRDQGYHETSIDDICQGAEISKGSFYWHYGAKIDVFGDILEEWARQVVDELLEAFEGIPDEPSPIKTLIQVFAREFSRARAIVPLWAEFTLHAQRDREVQASLTKFYRRTRSAIVEILRRSAGDILTEAQLQGTAAVILGAYAGLTLQDLADPQASSESWVHDFLPVLGLLIDGLQLSQGLPPLGQAPPPGAREPLDRLEAFAADASPQAAETLWRARALITQTCPSLRRKVDPRLESPGLQPGHHQGSPQATPGPPGGRILPRPGACRPAKPTRRSGPPPPHEAPL